MTTSPFDHPLLSGLLKNTEVTPYFSADAEIKEMIRFEVALAEAEGAKGVIPGDSAAHIVEQLHLFEANLDEIRVATTREGAAGVEFVRQLRHWHGPPYDQQVQFGALCLV